MANGTGRTLTEQELALLADIFRVILKEISSSEDIENLAPGELGINYRDGSLYVRNPHNGKLFSPNSVEYLKPILDKFTPGKNILNADIVAGITFYSRIGMIDQAGDILFTPDTLISRMVSPSIFFGQIDFENCVDYGWPAEYGTVLIFKTNEECVLIRYFDPDSNIAYVGRYNRFRHTFDGWALDGDVSSGFAETLEGGDMCRIRTNIVLDDLSVITVRVTEDINPGATLSINDNPPLPIYKQDKTPLDFTITADNSIMFMYDEVDTGWTLLESTDSVFTSQARVLMTRLMRAVEEFERYESETDDTLQQHGMSISKLRSDLNDLQQLEARDVQSLTNMIGDARVSLSKSISDLRYSVEQEFSSTRVAFDSAIVAVNNRIDALESDVSSRLESIVQSFNSALETMTTNIGNRFAEIEGIIATRPGNIQEVVVDYVAGSNGITLISAIDEFDGTVDKLIVNYGQTILKVGLDYTIVDNGIRFSNVCLSKDDVVQFIILKQAKQ